MGIAVVVPTVRPESLKTFEKAWDDLFRLHNVTVVVVKDGKIPELYVDGEKKKYPKHLLDTLIYNLNDGVRNLGFWYIAKYLPYITKIITLDDDVAPIGNTIQDHLDALNQRVPVSWLSTADHFMRGFPYELKKEAEVVLSHGVWRGVKDWDAPTQLLLDDLTKPVTFYRGPIPKGIFYPMCGMNIAFKRKMLPYMYYAPMGYKVGMDRFADIWLGIESKKIIDSNGWAVVSGYANVLHDRASNVWKNLQKEAKGLELNEGYWRGIEDDPYFKLYAQKRKLWEDEINAYLL
jgi:reversibly glycosylated polypeptide/UDP-arabinopyranose mutase